MSIYPLSNIPVPLDGPWRDNASAYDMAEGMKSEDRKQQRCGFAEERL